MHDGAICGQSPVIVLAVKVRVGGIDGRGKVAGGKLVHGLHATRDTCMRGGEVDFLAMSRMQGCSRCTELLAGAPSTETTEVQTLVGVHQMRGGTCRSQTDYLPQQPLRDVIYAPAS